MIFFLLLIKRKIYLLGKTIPLELIEMYERLYEDIRNLFRGKYRLYKKSVSKFLSNDLFCTKEERIKIINSPSNPMIIQFLISKLKIDDEDKKKIFNFIIRSCKNGYSLVGKTIRGIVAGAVILFIRKNKLPLIQKSIYPLFGTNHTTSHKRRKELCEFYRKDKQVNDCGNKRDGDLRIGDVQQDLLLKLSDPETKNMSFEDFVRCLKDIRLRSIKPALNALQYRKFIEKHQFQFQITELGIKALQLKKNKIW